GEPDAAFAIEEQIGNAHRATGSRVQSVDLVAVEHQVSVDRIPGAVLAQHVDWHRKRELVNAGVDGDQAMVGMKPENPGHAVSQDRPGGREVDELLNGPRSGI